MKRYFFSTFFLFLGVLGPFFQNASAKSLPDVINAAMNHHPRLKQEQFNVRIAHENIVQARSRYLPTVDLQASLQRSRREAVLRDGTLFDGTTNPQNISLSASQTLFTGGRRHLEIGRARLEHKARKKEQENTQLSVKESIIETYIRGLSAQRIIKARQANVDALEALLKGMERQFQAGDGTQTEVAQTEARLAEAQAQLASDHQTLQQLKSQLFRETDLQVDQFEPISHQFPNDLSLELIVERANAYNPGLEAGLFGQRAAHLSVVSAGRTSLPSVALTGRASAFRESSPTIDKDDEYSFGLTLSMPFYSGGLNASQKRQAVTAYKAAQYAREDRALQMASYVANLWRSLQSSKAITDARKKRYNASLVVVDGIKMGQKAGLYSLLDHLNALDEQIRAEIGLIEAFQQEARASLLLQVNIGLDISSVSCNPMPSSFDTNSEERSHQLSISEMISQNLGLSCTHMPQN